MNAAHAPPPAPAPPRSPPPAPPPRVSAEEHAENVRLIQELRRHLGKEFIAANPGLKRKQ